MGFFYWDTRVASAQSREDKPSERWHECAQPLRRSRAGPFSLPYTGLAFPKVLPPPPSPTDTGCKLSSSYVPSQYSGGCHVCMMFFCWFFLGQFNLHTLSHRSQVVFLPYVIDHITMYIRHFLTAQ